MPKEKKINPYAILAKHYDPQGDLYGLLVTHSLLVTKKSLFIAHTYKGRNPDSEVDFQFIEEAALLHDIGIGQCDAPDIFCTGKAHYICHGVIGHQILEAEGLPKHALVAERHSGSGISLQEVLDEDLPLPHRNYLPISVEEKIICIADKFYSKSGRKLWNEKKPYKIYKGLAKWGKPTIERWENLCKEIYPEALDKRDAE